MSPFLGDFLRNNFTLKTLFYKVKILIYSYEVYNFKTFVRYI